VVRNADDFHCRTVQMNEGAEAQPIATERTNLTVDLLRAQFVVIDCSQAEGASDHLDTGSGVLVTKLSLTPISVPIPVLGRSMGGTKRRPIRGAGDSANVLL
jgi:hypothetical protein